MAKLATTVGSARTHQRVEKGKEARREGKGGKPSGNAGAKEKGKGGKGSTSRQLEELLSLKRIRSLQHKVRLLLLRKRQHCPAAATSSPTSAPVPPVQSLEAAAPSSSSTVSREMMAMNQQLVATMLRRMDLEKERRNKAEEKVFEAAEAPKRQQWPLRLGTPSSRAQLLRAVLLLLQLLFLLPPWRFQPSREVSAESSFDRPSRQGKGRMKEVETWHSFMETLSSWLALKAKSKGRALEEEQPEQVMALGFIASVACIQGKRPRVLSPMMLTPLGQGSGEAEPVLFEE